MKPLACLISRNGKLWRFLLFSAELAAVSYPSDLIHEHISDP